MYQLVLILHIFIAACLIALVLVQQGKGADASMGFSGGASQTLFGSQGSHSFLFKLTALLGLLFFVTSVWLTYLTTHGSAAAHSGGTAPLVRDLLPEQGAPVPTQGQQN